VRVVATSLFAAALVAADGSGGGPTKPGAPSIDGGALDRTALGREVTPELQRAVQRGLEYLVSRQDVVHSGSFGEASGRVAITGLACLALMANGNTDRGGRYGANVAAALRYLIRRTDEKSGYIYTQEDDLSRMHGHGYATLALAEAYGMFGVRPGSDGGAPSRQLADALHRAIRCIERAQTSEGGWYYEPTDEGLHEGSITICVLQALRSARNAGIAVKPDTIRRAIDYVKKSQNENGSFAYSLRERRSSVALTAAAVATLNALGEYDGPVVARGMDYLTTHFESNLKSGEWYFYANTYAAQAFDQARDRRIWQRFFPMLRDHLIAGQRDDGSWDQPGTKWRSFGPVYSTVCALLILQIPYRYLPIFQR
jgi:squalene cyclase